MSSMVIIKKITTLYSNDMMSQSCLIKLMMVVAAVAGGGTRHHFGIPQIDASNPSCINVSRLALMLISERCLAPRLGFNPGDEPEKETEGSSLI